MYLKYCGTCALFNENKCGIFGHPVDAETDFCSKHKENPQSCEICGGFIIDNSNSFLTMGNDNEYHELCGRCVSAIGYCSLCSYGRVCRFETDPNPLPKAIPIQQRQGNMIIQQLVKNPERIKATCGDGCRCWQNEQCQKENGCCKNFHHNLFS